jgi:uncharacterized BrkB/YihY/UPF0761 family membrane protein
MNARADPYGRDARRPYEIPLKGWWQVAQRVWSESVRDNLSLVAAGCAFYALIAIFPILSALIAVLVLTLLSFLYRYGPCRRNAKWHWVSVGSLFATALWLIASAVFSFYVSVFANYDKTYGALGAVIVLLIWLYLSFFIVLLGAEVNAELELQTAQDTTVGRPKPMGRRGAFVADHVAGGPQADKRPVSPVARDPSAAKPSGA